MAGKTKEMSQIKQLLLLKKEGVSNRKAAAIVGINKETVNNYVKKALADELGLEGLLKIHRCCISASYNSVVQIRYYFSAVL